MRCPECQTELPDAAKFCDECGARAELVCPGCGEPNRAGAKFCLECGHSLRTSPTAAPPRDLSFDEKLAKIQKYLPSGLTEKVLSQKDRIEGERRQVTIMFLDMKGFTPLTEKLGPEETFNLMDQVFELMIHKVHDYDGTVNELRGDGMLAFFGAPIALEDAPQRAIRSALSIHREMTRFNDKIKGDDRIPPVLLRIGINTGPVVVGTVGNDLRVQFTAVGDTINMAARMEQLAEPGTTYVTQDTFKLTEGFFRFEALGEKQVKGKEEPLKVYQVIAPSSRRTRFDVAAERGLTRFVGRERELEIMLDAFERAKRGRGQAVSLVGEAGVGKSRLLYEFRKAMANEDVTFLEGKCLSYGRGTAYHPITDILKANFDIQDGDGDAEIRNKVKRGLELLKADEASTLPYLLELLSVKDSGIDNIQMSPEGKKDRIIQVIKGISLKGSELRPLIMAIEDLHWMDKSSEDVCKFLLESIPGAKILLIFTYRPEFVQTWGGKSYHSQINLNRLANRESLAMVAHLLGTENFSEDLEDLILEKTEGIPFFIEEFTRSLKDLGIIVKQGTDYSLAADREGMPIPSTIHDVIMARVDGLPEGPKQILQTGSVIEREFSYTLIKSVIDIPEQELISHLSALKDSELLYERGIFPECTYVFKHALTREVVYNSIMASRKKKLHLVIGSVVEELFKGNIDEHYELLAEHHVKGEHWEKAAEFSRLAGKKVAKAGSINNAIVYGRKTVASLKRLPETVDVQKKMIDARAALGLYFLQVGHAIEAKEAVEPIVDLAVKHDYRRRLSQIFTVLGTHKCWVEEDFPKALRHLEEAQRIAKQENDVLSLFFANFWLGQAESMVCEHEKASHNLEEALRISEAAHHLWGMSVIKSSLSWFVYYYCGDMDLAYETCSESLAVAEQSSDIYSMSMTCVARGCSVYGKGFLEEALDFFSRGVGFTESLTFFIFSAVLQLYLGEVCFEIGDYERSRDHYDKATALFEEEGIFPSFKYLSRIGSSMARVMNNDNDVDLELLYTYVPESRAPSLEGWMRRYLGEILLNIDDQHMSEAQHWIEEAIQADERNGMRFHLGRDIALYAELFRRMGDGVKAKEQLGKAIEIYRECGADGWVTKTEEELETVG